MANKYSIGIGLNLIDARAVILRDDGRVIAEVSKNRKVISANEIIEDLVYLQEGIVKKADKYKDDILGVGCAFGGIIHDKKEVVYFPHQQGSYVTLPLREYLEKKFGYSVHVENDANACAWAEYTINYSKYKNILYMFSGVGCGIIIDGKLYRGKHGSAGEVFLNPAKVMTSRLGDFSFLGQWPDDLGMVKRAKELISLGKDTALIKKITPTGELFLNDIFCEAKKKDKVAREVVKEAGFALGVKIAFLVNLFNPEVVVIGGGLEEAADILLEECIGAVKTFSFHDIRKNLKIELSELGRKAAAVGAASILLKEKSLQK